ncbi:MAG: HAMP domain-containing histidine kinase [Phycisphaerales bacterium]|nr:MAG: HAMP domain-containing histidine kinase [Phycisphaerales bacterium]
MVSDESIQPAVYELPLPAELSAKAEIKGSERSLPEPLLAQNALWFCRCRWFVIVALVFYGALGLFPGSTDYFGMRPPGTWPFVTAAVLTLSNFVFLFFARTKTSATRTTLNLWSQIIADLVVLTAVVYFVGNLETNIAFTYLFHIVLSCVFFSRRQSLIVTIVAIGMFTTCVTAEYILRVLPPTSIFAASHHEPEASSAPMVLLLNFFFAIGIWLAVWYLASGLSSMVRQRDFELAETNRRLMAAQKERSRHMLATTHQLKAPFAAIYSNAQLLLQGYCGDLQEQALQVIRRISSRCRRLTAEIQEMLQLANLSSTSQQPLPGTKMVSTELLLWCMSQVEPVAREHGVVFKANIRPAAMVGTEDHFKMLFVNLLSNAVVYSHKNGQVHVSCLRGPSSEPIVTIADDGIGIPANKLPHIFEEHYRTKEAVQHNKESSGLGLSIVKQVAEMYRISIRVESHPGCGTKFELRFPAPDTNLGNNEEGETKWPTS